MQRTAMSAFSGFRSETGQSAYDPIPVTRPQDAERQLLSEAVV